MVGDVGSPLSDAVLTTERLVLSPVEAPDRDTLHALFIDPDVRRYLWDDQTIPLTQTADIVKRSVQLMSSERYGIWLITGRAPLHGTVGFTGLWPFRDPPVVELLFGIAKRWWGRGLAGEAARAVIAHAFDTLGFARVDASTDALNTASLRVLDKLGMRLVRRETVAGLDTIFYTIDANEFRVF